MLTNYWSASKTAETDPSRPRTTRLVNTDQVICIAVSLSSKMKSVTTFSLGVPVLIKTLFLFSTFRLYRLKVNVTRACVFSWTCTVGQCVPCVNSRRPETNSRLSTRLSSSQFTDTKHLHLQNHRPHHLARPSSIYSYTDVRVEMFPNEWWRW